MTVTLEPWTSVAPLARRQLVQVPPAVLDALGKGHLETAQGLWAQPLTPYIISEECRGVWEMRSKQVIADPEDAVWITRLIVDSETGVAVGHAGYHGQPNHDGMVEIGYSVDPLYRRQGHARAAVGILLNVAAGDPRVRVVRASVRPDNMASRRLMDKYGFQEVGAQWDDEDGLEAVLEISAL